MKKQLIILLLCSAITVYGMSYTEYMVRGNNYYLAKNYKYSLDSYIRAYKIKKNDKDALLGIANSYQGLNRMYKASNVYDLISKLYPNTNLDQKKQIEEPKLIFKDEDMSTWTDPQKEKYYKKFENYLKSIDYNSSEEIYTLGRIYMNENSFERAYNIFRKEKNSDYRNYFGAATAGRFIGKYDEAILFYNKLLDLKPDFYEGYLGLGIAYQLKKEYNLSIKILETYLMHNDDENVYLGISYMYEAQDKYNSAKDILQRAQTKFPNSKEIRKNLGKIYTKLGRD